MGHDAPPDCPHGVSPMFLCETCDVRQWRTTTLPDVPRGRPPIGPPFQIRLPDDLLAKLDARAAAEGVSRAEMVRRLLAVALP